MAEANAEWDLDLGSWPGLEAQVAAIADDIAYDNHDIDDGLRSGLLDLDELIELPLVQRHWAAIGERHPGISTEKRQRALVRDMIGTMVSDVLAETQRRVRDAGVETIDDVRRAGRALAGFSRSARRRGARAEALPLRAPLRLRRSSSRCARRPSGSSPDLAAAYRDDPSLLPEPWQRGGDRLQQLRTIGDFIAGMTDRFAIARHIETGRPSQSAADRF